MPEDMPEDVESFAVAVRSIERFSDLRNAFIRYFRHEGVEMMSYHHLPPMGASDFSPTIAVAQFGFPDEWVTEYVGNRYYEIDPITKRALSSVTPLWWSDVCNASDLTASERRYVEALRRADFGDGIAIPLFGPHGRNGYSGLGCGTSGHVWHERKVARLHWAAQLGHQQYCHILHAHAPAGIVLSQREREILEWVAKGKSNTSIASILDISPNTVDSYMRRIFEKLDVADRVTALLRGLAVGVIGV